jgi:hypothetical protein
MARIEPPIRPDEIDREIRRNNEMLVTELHVGRQSGGIREGVNDNVAASLPFFERVIVDKAG